MDWAIRASVFLWRANCTTKPLSHLQCYALALTRGQSVLCSFPWCFAPVQSPVEKETCYVTSRYLLVWGDPESTDLGSEEAALYDVSSPDLYPRCKVIREVSEVLLSLCITCAQTHPTSIGIHLFWNCLYGEKIRLETVFIIQTGRLNWIRWQGRVAGLLKWKVFRGSCDHPSLLPPGFWYDCGYRTLILTGVPTKMCALDFIFLKCPVSPAKSTVDVLLEWLPSEWGTTV